jgi:hypothetical protein
MKHDLTSILEAEFCGCTKYLETGSVLQSVSDFLRRRIYPTGWESDICGAGTLRSGGSGKKVRGRKQAIAIGLSEARREGKKVPKKKTA